MNPSDENQDTATIKVCADNREKGLEAYRQYRDATDVTLSKVNGGASPSFSITGSTRRIAQIKNSLREMPGIKVEETTNVPMRGRPVANMDVKSTEMACPA